MDESLLRKIEDLGLQANEARVYLSLLEIGEATVTQICKNAGLNRTTGYDILERLCLYGIVNKGIGGKKRLYIAESPGHLEQFLENKRRRAERRVQELKNLLPELKAIYKTELKPVIKIVEGVEAMRQMAYNELDAKGVIYSLVNLKNYAETFDEMGTHRSLERFKRGIKERCLSIDSDTARKWHNKTYSGKKKRQENTEYRWLPWDKRYSTAGEVAVYNDKVMGILSKSSENVAFEIQSQTFADFLKIIFEMAWKATK
jgi:sugar-specific transcriptional regulator TrmB